MLLVSSLARLVLLGGVAGAQVTTSTTVDVAGTTRAPAIVFLVSPFGAATTAGTSRILSAVDAALHKDTDLYARTPQQAGLSEDALLACEAADRFGCWVRLTRESRASTLLVLSVSPAGPGQDRFVTTGFDLEAAQELLDRSDASGQSAEDRLFELATHVAPRTVQSSEAGAVERHITEVVTEDLRAMLERSGHWRPFGEIELNVDCIGCALKVDDVPVGVVSSQSVVIIGARSGRRSVHLSRGGHLVRACTADVAPASRATAACVATELESSSSPSAFLLYGGVVAAGLGAVAIVYATERSANGPDVYCLRQASDEGCPAVGFADSGFSTSNAPSTALDRGVPLVPIGAALLAMGASWIVGHFVGPDVPEWMTVVGVGVGASAFAVTWAVGR